MHPVEYMGETAIRSDARELEHIEMYADRVSTIADRLEGFVARFHGHPKGAQEAGATGMAPVPAGYRGQMDRLSGKIVEVENLVEQLIRIG